MANPTKMKIKISRNCQVGEFHPRKASTFELRNEVRMESQAKKDRRILSLSLAPTTDGEECPFFAPDGTQAGFYPPSVSEGQSGGVLPSVSEGQRGGAMLSWEGVASRTTIENNIENKEINNNNRLNNIITNSNNTKSVNDLVTLTTTSGENRIENPDGQLRTKTILIGNNSRKTH